MEKLIHIIIDDKNNFENIISKRLEGKYPILSWGTEHYIQILANLHPEQLVCTWIHIRQYGSNDMELEVDDRLIGLEWAEILQGEFPSLEIYFVTSGKAERVNPITKGRAYLYRQMNEAVKSKKAILQKVGDILSSKGSDYLKISEEKKNLQKKRTNNNSIKKEDVRTNIALISALYRDEFENIKGLVKDAKKVDGFETLKYCTLKNSEKKILIDFQSDMGMIDAACLSTQLLENFNLKYLIMVGVCGGRALKGVKICDVIIPDAVYDYQTGKYERGKFIPTPRMSSINNKRCVDISDEIKNKIVINIKRNFRPSLTKIKDFEFHYKTLACGNVVLKTDGHLEGEIAKYDDHIVGIEMESFGVVRALELLADKHVKPIIIKSVMDFTEADKNDNDKPTAAYISSQFAYYLIKDYLD